MAKDKQTEFFKICLADALIQLMFYKAYEDIKINEICETAGIGRATFYRHFGSKANKQELIIYKVKTEWQNYQQNHIEEVHIDRGKALFQFIYENRKLFRLLHQHKLVSIIMVVIENFMIDGEFYDKKTSYLMSYFTYGYFGLIYQWIKYDFDESPEEVMKHINDILFKSKAT
ncbi:TPA: TetR/AcrR family transcriptional regulator [Streptococcus suis]|uniref:TetR/AcrR family transcriptional regulator n=1 Tax=Streptococcus suis TaxID=1307 RepID=UPI000492D775|nr:TetR/AcrR family transcriptional regulator [Streptococcus suis]QZT29206.1 TetR/AcrR family transcriptional regulator [Streptococcus suis]HEL1906873.1 TetR/AcrR family transcriptional regulator [Streptococcus suis]HEM3164912.1 TetR/AcrR family transcriptional regulator [Streptococcus suis 92-1191]HEM6180905.1 TetR/AcrR family transcriptional regulator [Streptococcus suis]